MLSSDFRSLQWKEERWKVEGGNRKRNHKIWRFLRPADHNVGMQKEESINPRNILIAERTLVRTIKHMNE